MFALFYADDTRSVRQFRNGCWEDVIYKRFSDCVQALERHIKKHPDQILATFMILTVEDFRKVELVVERRNLMSGKPFKTSINTPACCDPSTETYWSM